MTNKEKEQFFIERTKRQYPANWQLYCDMIAHEAMSKEELAAYNFRQRQEIVRYAYENSPFYRKLYDEAGFKPEDLRTEDDWLRIPVVTKQMLKDNYDSIIVGGRDGELATKFGVVKSTGGSTGKPLQVIEDTRYELSSTYLWRCKGWWTGRKRGELTGETPVIGQDECILEHYWTKEQIEQRAKLFHPTFMLWVDTVDMSEQYMSELVETFRQHPGMAVYGLGGALEEFAQFLTDHQISLDIPFSASFATPVTAIARRIIETGFNCRLYDVYSCVESWHMAAECPQSEHNLHVHTDLRNIEILDANRMPVQGEDMGTIYQTSFTNHIMPLVRYCMEDRSHWINHDCACGLPFPLMARVEGRNAYHIIDKNGNPCFGYEQYFWEQPQYFDNYQFIQHAPGEVTVKVVINKNNPNSMAGYRQVLDTIQKHGGDKFHFTFEQMDDIPFYNGKHRTVIFE